MHLSLVIFMTLQTSTINKQAFSSTWFFLRTRTPRPPAAPFHMAANATPASMRQCSLFPLPKQPRRWYSCLGLRVEQTSTVPRLWSETGWERLWMQTVSYLPLVNDDQNRYRTAGVVANVRLRRTPGPVCTGCMKLSLPELLLTLLNDHMWGLFVQLDMQLDRLACIHCISEWIQLNCSDNANWLFCIKKIYNKTNPFYSPNVATKSMLWTDHFNWRMS